ncbi:Rib/alpha-like domain-containing protein [Corynebacterium aquatimens]|uniref:Rib/alpha/Esp surface antigen-like repeat protein n=1 Tax=Corynebacterium aquatimens TaxID=1190508 RepID=A0A931E345_9CORY|nr:Rib/alpha-like domain-containing protein [Corynebacterium aquatimens]MBG6122916.1 Rib/alpha/Esp surface antigen-like repeat protein [Corynebacterium aquatimens]WJY66749.1 C protein alpha-antigen precursor [Corynebacterium aquatimens]
MSANSKATRRNIGLAALAATSLTAGLVVAPHSDAQEVKTTQMKVVMGCNLQIKQADVPRVFRGLLGGAEGVYNGGSDKYNMIRFAPSVTAPVEVEEGKQFDYVVELGKVGAPAQIALASVQSADQMNVWLDLPQNATLNEVVLTGGDPNVTYKVEGNRIRLFQEGGADVSKWTEAGEAQWVHGGLKTKREQVNGIDQFVVDFPKVTLKMTPKDGTAGQEVAPYLDRTDPKAFSPKAFAQLYANANAVGQNANAFVRCGLSETDTTGGDNKTEKSDLFPSVKVKEAKQTEAATTTPTAKDAVTITKGDALPDAKAQLSGVPANATAKWTTTHTEIGDDQKGGIKVTYADGSTDDVNITVNVKRALTQAEQFDPKAIQDPKPVYYQGEPLPAAKDSVVEPDALPAGTTFEWKYPANKIGENLTGTVVITYPDGSKDEVTRPVAVRPKKTQADENDPKPITEPRLKYTLGDPDPDPRERIQDFDKLPAGTTAAWTSARGKVGPNLTGIITVTYPDGSKDEVRLPVDVSAAYAPQPKANPTDVAVGADIADEDAKAQIANADKAPEGTTFTWKTKPATTTAGVVTGVVTVKVPNKEAVDVEVQYEVIAADDNTWRPQVTTEVQTIEKDTDTATLTDSDAKNLVTNFDDAPADAKVAWKTKPDTSKAGATTGVITITTGEGADAKSVDRTVRFNVTETYKPEAKKDLKVEIGTEISDDAAVAAIANVPSAPFGTEYKWSKKPDTSKVGKTTGTVEVSIPGEAPQQVRVEVVTVPYEVTSSFEPKKNDTPADVAYGTDTSKWGEDEAASMIQNGIEAPEGTTYEWVTKPKTDAEGKQTGTIKVTVPGHVDPETNVAADKVFNVDVEINVVDAPVEVEPFVAKPAEGLKAKQGHLVKDIHARESIANKNDAPEGTTFAWKDKPSTQNIGPNTGVVIVKVPGQDKQEVTINYVIEPRDPETASEKPKEIKKSTLRIKVKGANGEPKANAEVNIKVNGVPFTRVTDANGEATIEIEETANVNVEYDGSNYYVDPANGAQIKVTEDGKPTPGTIAGAVISALLLVGAVVPIPGLKDAITNVQKQLGIFNPQIADIAAKAQPAVFGIAGIVGLGLTLNEIFGKNKLGKTENNKETITVTIDKTTQN